MFGTETDPRQVADFATCLDCMVEKPKGDFYAHVRTGLSDVCKTCTVEANRLRRNDSEAYKARVALRKACRKTVGAPDHKVCTKCSRDLGLSEFRVKSRGLYGRSSWCSECETIYDKERRSGPDREKLLSKRRQDWAEKPRTEEEKARAALRARTWYAENRAARADTFRMWASAHRTAVNAISARRRANKAAVVNDLTRVQWEETLEMFNHACAYCLRSDVGLSMDHMIPIVKGGAHSQDNVVPACKSCNSKKGPRSIFTMA